MPKILLPIITSRSENEQAIPEMVGARLVNGYVDLIGNKPAIRKIPGLELLINLGISSPIDGLFWWDQQGVALAICNGKIYKITSSTGNYTNITGDALTVVGPTNFSSNGTYGILASGGKMVTTNAGGTTAFMADADAPTAVTSVAFMDKYIFANKVNTTSFYWSDVNSPLDWTATSFASAESKPDYLIALQVEDREITLFCKEKIEIYYDDGVTPFSRLEGAFINRGVLAPNSIKYYGGTWYFLDQDRHVCSLTGRSPSILSNPYDEYIRDIKPVTDAIGSIVTFGKQVFYVLTWPTHKFTLVYNILTSSWAEWGDWDSANSVYTAWKGKNFCYCRAWDIYLVGDATTGKIYKINPSLFQNNGEIIRTLIRTGQVNHGTNEQKISKELIVECKRGVGGISGDEPVFTHRYRDENGTWSNEQQISLGKIGDTNSIQRLHRLGMYRTRQHEFVHSDNSDFILSDLEELL
jgi:hypothetical protein